MGNKYYSHRPDLMSSANDKKLPSNDQYSQKMPDKRVKINVLESIETVTQTVQNEGVSDLYVQTGDAYLGKISEMDTETFGNAYDRLETLLNAAKGIHDEIMQRIDGKFTKGVDNSLKSLNKVNGSDNPYETTHLTYETEKTHGEGNNIRTETVTNHYTLDELLGKDSPIVAAQTVYNNYLLQTRAAIESEAYTNMTDEEIMAQYYPTGLPDYQSLKRSQFQEDHQVGLSYIETAVAAVLVVAAGAATFGTGSAATAAALSLIGYSAAEAVSVAATGSTLITGSEVGDLEKAFIIATAVTGVLTAPGIGIGSILKAGGASSQAASTATRVANAADDVATAGDIAQGTVNNDDRSLDLALLLLGKGRGTGTHAHTPDGSNLPNGADAAGRTNSAADVPNLRVRPEGRGAAIPDVQGANPESSPSLQKPNISPAESDLSAPDIPSANVDLTTPHIPRSNADLSTPDIPQSDVDLTPPNISGRGTTVASAAGGAAVTAAKANAVDVPKAAHIDRSRSTNTAGNSATKQGTGQGLSETKIWSPEWQTTKRNFPNPGLTDGQSSAITSIAKGNRPDPSTYLSSDYMDQHRSQFDSGAVAFARDTSNLERFGQFGRDDGAFVLPRDIAEAMIKEANGDPRALEALLGLDNGSLGDNPVLLGFENVENFRIPNGNEAGSNDFWRPGGLTYPGGVPEAVINPVPADQVEVMEIW